MAGSSGIYPGSWVRHPQEEAWGMGQIQSVVGFRVTVNFEHAGKRLILVDKVSLLEVEDEPRRLR